MIKAEEVRGLVKRTAKLEQCPLNENFQALGLTQEQMNNVCRALLRNYQRTVPVIAYSDTIYTLTDKLTGIKPISI